MEMSALPQVAVTLISGKGYKLCKKSGGRFGDDKILLTLLGFKPRTIHPAVYAD